MNSSAADLWSPVQCIQSAFKELDPTPQFKATAKLGAFSGRAGISLK